MRWLCVMIALSGCGDTPTGFRSGSRLRARILDAGGGARSFAEFVDNAGGEPCQFLSIGGELRCLPTRMMTVAYADPTCGHPVGLGEPDCDQKLPRYAALGGGYQRECRIGFPSSAGLAQIYAVGARLSAQTYYVRSSTGCVKETLPSANVGLYDLAGVTPTVFVRAALISVAHGELGTMMYAGDDGSRLAVGLYDVKRGPPCAPALSPQSRCISGRVEISYDYFFSDPQCGAPVAVISSGCGKPELVVRQPFDCTPPSLHTVGDEIDPATLFESIPGDVPGCRPSPGIQPSYPIGDEVAPESFPLLREKELGGAAVTLSIWTTGSGEPLDLPASGFKRRGSQGPCTPFKSVDGKTHCVDQDSPQVYGLGSFADAACTHAIVAGSRWLCGAAPTLGVRVAPGTGCDGSVLQSTFTVGAPIDVAMVYRSDPAGCVAEVPSPYQTYYEIGETGDLSSLPVIEERVE